MIFVLFSAAMLVLTLVLFPFYVLVKVGERRMTCGEGCANVIGWMVIIFFLLLLF